MIVDLDTVKQHLRVSSTDEDTLISLYMDAAETHIADYLDDVYLGTPQPDEPVENPTINPNDIPAPIKSALLLLVADMYANREAQGEKLEENPAVTRLLFPYRKKLGV